MKHVLGAACLILLATGAAQAQSRPAPRGMLVRQGLQPAAARHYYTVVGSVNRAGVFVSESPQLPLSELIAAAGGTLAGEEPWCKIVRPRSTASSHVPAGGSGPVRMVQSGDIVIAGPSRNDAAAVPELSVACVGLAEYPVVWTLDDTIRDVEQLARRLGQSTEFARTATVVGPSGALVRGQFEAGTVIVFDARTIDRAALAAAAQLPSPVLFPANPIQPVSAPVSPAVDYMTSPVEAQLPPAAAQLPAHPEEPQPLTNYFQSAELPAAPEQQLPPPVQAAPAPVEAPPPAPLLLSPPSIPLPPVSSPASNPYYELTMGEDRPLLPPRPGLPDGPQVGSRPRLDVVPAVKIEPHPLQTADVNPRLVPPSPQSPPVAVSASSETATTESRAYWTIAFGISGLALVCVVLSIAWAGWDGRSKQPATPSGIVEHTPAASPSPQSTLEELLSGAIPMVEEAVAIQPQRPLHGSVVGHRRVRIDPLHETMLGPHYARPELRPARQKAATAKSRIDERALRESLRSGLVPASVVIDPEIGASNSIIAPADSPLPIEPVSQAELVQDEPLSTAPAAAVDDAAAAIATIDSEPATPAEDPWIALNDDYDIVQPAEPQLHQKAKSALERALRTLDAEKQA